LRVPKTSPTILGELRIDPHFCVKRTHTPWVASGTAVYTAFPRGRPVARCRGSGRCRLTTHDPTCLRSTGGAPPQSGTVVNGTALTSRRNEGSTAIFFEANRRTERRAYAPGGWMKHYIMKSRSHRAASLVLSVALNAVAAAPSDDND